MLRLLGSLAKEKAHEFVVVLPDIPEYSTTRAPNLRLLLRPKHSNLLGRHLHLNHTIPKVCRQAGAEALLCMGNFGPLRPPIPTILFVRNAYYAYKEQVAYMRATWRERLIIRYGWKHYRRLASNVGVVVQTEVMKQRMTAFHGLNPAKVVVIPDTEALPRQPHGTVSPRKRSCSDPFTFLCLAVYSPHKNLEILQEAMRKVSAYSNRQARCVITVASEQHPGARRLLKEIKRRKLEDLVMNIGPVHGRELERAYMTADAVIQPTLLESFGRVYLESMFFDLPILTSDRDFAHERCQDAALYFDPLDADSVGKAMARMMEEGELRQRLVENARRILARAPTWDYVAGRFVKVLERVARGQLPGLEESLSAADDLFREASGHVRGPLVLH